MSVRHSLDTELNAMPASVRDSTLAQVARTLADTLDDEVGARDAASVAKELRACLVDLQSRAGEVPSEVDPVDRLESAGPTGLAGTVIPIGSRRSG